MQISKSIQFVLITLSLFTVPTFVQAANKYDGYEEVSYDDLLNELNAKKSSFERKQKDTSLENVRLHAGVGYANSFSNISAQRKNFNRHANGIQLSLGMDLFSPNWYSEGIFRNYGLTTSGSEELTLREFDLKMGYTNKLESIWSYTLSTGLSNRFLKFSDPTQNIDVDVTTPSMVVSTGFKAQVHNNISLGAELSARTALIDNTADKNSFDFAFRINTSL